MTSSPTCRQPCLYLAVKMMTEFQSAIQLDTNVHIQV